ncbi:MAG: phycobiliprotein lyase, partial [Leptolyngbyaceae cyanobacterium RM2_2_21]|nr:phycobiliprotein lyase [Leptolyngbyaceae cyanobacterium RM2_2_21]
MEIVNFFEKLEGSWFSQRTTHYVSTQTSQSGQSDLKMERVSAKRPREVTQAFAPNSLPTRNRHCWECASPKTV